MSQLQKIFGRAYVFPIGPVPGPPMSPDASID